MAAFLLVRDADPERRARCLQAALRRLEALGDVAVGRHESGVLAMAWAVNPTAPVDHASEHGRHVLIIGDALDDSGSFVGGADHLRAIAERPHVMYDGYHAVVSYSDDGAFAVDADPLGLFPVNYTSLGDSVLVASHPALLEAHPDYRPALDPLGLASVLSLNGIVGGHTVHRNVRRLAQGSGLAAGPSGVATETARWRIPVSSRLWDAPLDICAEEVHEALTDACRRHVRAEVPHSLMLSGGLDSRLIAGVLVREGRLVTAVTRGRRSDIEYRCALAVTRHLGIEHHLVGHSEQGPENFAQMLEWEGLTTSPGTGASGSGAAAIRRFHPRAVTGYIGNAVLGGTTINWKRRAGTPDPGFEWTWQRHARWGIPRPLLERLLRRDVFGRSLDEVRDAMRVEYEGNGSSPHERMYRTGFRVRQRFGTGDALAPLAFGAWPVSPLLDRRLFEVCGSTPPAVFAGRGIQKYVVEKYHLGLACLPLDRNSFDDRPLVPRVSHLIRHAMAVRFRPFAKAMGLHPERRYYVRTYDINGAHWRAIRRLVEPRRERAYTLFDRELFDELIPPPDVRIPTREGVQDVAAKKSLLAVLAMESLTTRK